MSTSTEAVALVARRAGRSIRRRSVPVGGGRLMSRSRASSVVQGGRGRRRGCSRDDGVRGGWRVGEVAVGSVEQSLDVAGGGDGSESTGDERLSVRRRRSFQVWGWNEEEKISLSKQEWRLGRSRRGLTPVVLRRKQSRVEVRERVGERVVLTSSPGAVDDDLEGGR